MSEPAVSPSLKEQDAVTLSSFCRDKNHDKCEGDYSWLSAYRGQIDFICECDCHDERASLRKTLEGK